MRRLLRLAAILLLAGLAAGCAGVEMGASGKEIVAARHVSDEAPYVAVVSMVSNETGWAAHTALVINASQRVIYDPAGTFRHPDMPERGDVHYGADDRMLSYYERYHARLSHHVHVQKIPVPLAVAERALRRAEAQGPSPKLWCTWDTVQVLNDVEGLPRFDSTFFPQQLRAQIARVPGVEDRFRHERDRGQMVPAG